MLWEVRLYRMSDLTPNVISQLFLKYFMKISLFGLVLS